MRSLFFYGTLRHLPLLEIVIGKPLGDSCIPARLHGHQAYKVKDHDFPMIMEDSAEAEGLLLRDVTADEEARLNFYEGGFNYELRKVSVQTADGDEDALVYFPLGAIWQPDGLWSLDQWVASKSALQCLAATEVMRYFNVKSDAELEFMFPRIRARAANRLRAEADTSAFSPAGFHRSQVTTETTDHIHAGFFLFERNELSYPRYEGPDVGPIPREIFYGGDAAIVLPYDPVTDCVLLVEQFRAGAYARGELHPWVVEPIAGFVDADETPQEAAHREALEEAGLTLQSLHAVAKSYSSPGCSSEFYHIFVGLTDLPDTAAGLGGLEEESEDIKSYVLSYDRLMEIVDTLQANNTPLVTAALWLARHRDKLRSMA